MSDPFVGEIMMAGFVFAPTDYALCQGATMQITQYGALYSLCGVQFGGDGQSTFALPDMRGRAPMHRGNGVDVGDMSGWETITLTVNETGHRHSLMGSDQEADTHLPYNPSTGAKNNLSEIPVAFSPYYASASNLKSIATGYISPEGGNLPHDNMQPFLAINFCIALQGTYPSRN